MKSFSPVPLFATPWRVCSLPGSSDHGIFQARVLEWVAISFSRESERWSERPLAIWQYLLKLKLQLTQQVHLQAAACTQHGGYDHMRKAVEEEWGPSTCPPLVRGNGKIALFLQNRASLVAQLVENLPATQETTCSRGDAGSIPGSGRFSGKRNSSRLQHSCLENFRQRTWWPTVHGVTESLTEWLTHTYKILQCLMYPLKNKPDRVECSGMRWMPRNSAERKSKNRTDSLLYKCTVYPIRP